MRQISEGNLSQDELASIEACLIGILCAPDEEDDGANEDVEQEDDGA
ncbi:MAG: hypothetical protein WC822_02480 [Candidatus Paceibacterota bacterium]|jgi:hypothetical protein